ncbi:MFS transporter [Paraburkholderia elongata]|uniref:MFS transporter n=1 Tax=Paraburkholderia elongata TaxID=2675747 RepID=A0A972SGM2_9BURK|nr:MFS transporter [Paraburkholderia elongata]NPT55078.1 MFS transporter [Paraburkholderia elongata]
MTRRYLDVKGSKAAYLVALMSLCYMVSYLDRSVLTIVAQPLKSTLALSDTQLGVLQGFAFSIFFFIGGIPLGWMVDRTNRIRLVACCVLIWSTATMLCGFASNFGELFAARACTAAAEAVIVPAGLSLFADLLSTRRIPLASSILATSPFIGGGIALLLGGVALSYFGLGGNASWFLPGHQAWQKVYVLIGLLGIIPILLLLLVKEPQRKELDLAEKVEQAKMIGLSHTLKYLFFESKFYAPYITGVCTIFLVFYSVIAWFPILLSRQFQIAPAEVGKSLGPIFIIVGLFGGMVSQVSLRRVAPEKIVARIMAIILFSCAIQFANMLSVAFVRNIYVGMVLYAISTLLTGVVVSTAYTPIQLSVPNRMRGKAMAIVFCGINLLGTGLGPFLVGFFNDRVFVGADSLAKALCTVGSVAACLGALLFFRAWTVLNPPHVARQIG